MEDEETDAPFMLPREFEGAGVDDKGRVEAKCGKKNKTTRKGPGLFWLEHKQKGWNTGISTHHTHREGHWHKGFGIENPRGGEKCGQSWTEVERQNPKRKGRNN